MLDSLPDFVEAVMNEIIHHSQITEYISYICIHLYLVKRKKAPVMREKLYMTAYISSLVAVCHIPVETFSVSSYVFKKN